MAIKNGQIADADEVMNAFGKIFHNQAQIFISGNTAGSLLTNTIYNSFNSNNMVISGNVFYDSIGNKYIGGNFDNTTDYVSFDELNDNTVNTGSWNVTTQSGGTVTEINSKQQKILATNSDANDTSIGKSVSNGLQSGNLPQLINIDILNYSVSTGNVADASADAIIKLNGGSNIGSLHVTGANQSLNIGSSKVQLLYTTDNKTFYRFFSGTSWQSWNSNNGIKEIEFNSNAFTGNGFDSTSATINVNFLRRSTATDGTGTLTSSGTNTENVTNAINTWYDEGTVTAEFSANSGTNYTTSIKDQIIRPTAGTHIKSRFTFSNISELNNYSTIYNLY